tara:strand:+ start:52 stop:252 length:201 start_codon:yes stop_codon:yes gene_type:complete
MSDLNRLNHAKKTEEYVNYSEMSTDDLLSLEFNLSKEYHSILKLNELFNLDDYAEIIRELTIRENE